MNEVLLILPDTAEIDARVTGVVEAAKLFRIISDDGCRICIEREKALTILQKEIEEHHNEGIEIAHGLHKNLIIKRDKYLNPVLDAKKIYKTGRIAYADEQERIRKEAEAKLQAEARRLAEEAALREAMALEAEGRAEEAEAIIAEPVSVPTVMIPKTTPSAGIGGAIREIWSAEVYDLYALLLAIVEGQVSIGLIEPNQTALNGLARSLKGNMQVAGVRAISRKV